MKNMILSEGEWKLMNALWTNAPCSLSTLVAALDEETGWTKSTIFVMLRRLIAKDAVNLDQSGKIQLYTPLVNKEDCAIRETESFLSRVYNGSIGLMFSSLAGQKALSKDEIDELRKILDEAEEGLSDDNGQ
ncbi:MAG: BlaI/MecI/CopY family transcriptional regulator [Ruminococcaceae bacterium]|nr:BlaI/MecI/CopY family transcriptional regulator [Oscillospiraceae bacterium]